MPNTLFTGAVAAAGVVAQLQAESLGRRLIFRAVGRILLMRYKQGEGKMKGLDRGLDLASG